MSFNSPGHSVVPFVPGPTDAFAGITSTLQDASKTIKDLRNTADGVTRFFSAISSVISAVTSCTGWRAFVLLFGVICISAVLTFVGIPRGGVSFLISLAAADWIWVLWEKSFTPNQPMQYGPLLKANAVLLLPFLVVMMLKKIFPSLIGKIGSGMMSLLSLSFLKKRAVSKKSLIHVFNRYNDAADTLRRHLLHDILHSDEDRIVLSGNTLESINEVTRALHELKGTDGNRSGIDTKSGGNVTGELND